MAQRKIGIGTIVDVVATKLNLDHAAIADYLTTMQVKHRKSHDSGTATKQKLCVVDLFEENCTDVYRFRTDDHEIAMPGRLSYTELSIKYEEEKHHPSAKDGGSFPHVEQSRDLPDGFSMRCTCAKCHRSPQDILWCQPYRFGSTKKSRGFVWIHKFRIGRQSWAIILGELEFSKWRVWGSTNDNEPLATYYHGRILLDSSLQYKPPLNGQIKRAAQRDSVTPQSRGDFRTTDREPESSLRRSSRKSKPSERRAYHFHRRGSEDRRSESPDDIHDVVTSDIRNQCWRTASLGRTKRREPSVSDVHDSEVARDTSPETQQAASPTLRQKARKTSIVGRKLPAQAIEPSPGSQPMFPAASDNAASPTSNTSSTDSTTSTQAIVRSNTTRDHAATPVSALTLEEKFEVVFAHVLLLPANQPGTKLRHFLEGLRTAAEKSDHWQFETLRRIIDNILKNDGLEPLPA